jgi:heat-inducible transcriptional repressor
VSAKKEVNMSLNRSDAILKYIVEYFIRTAQPVGSKTLIDEFDLPYSSATIRNEMYALEKMGMIEKTHTSSGRVPSSQGYKYYCENLREKNVDEEIKYSIQQVLKQRNKSIEEIIQASCEIISHMTSLVSVILGPDEAKEKLANVQLIRVNENTLTAIFVTNSGYVENKTFICPDNITGDEIMTCVKLLNERLQGTPISALVEKMESLRPIFTEQIVNHDIVYQALLQTLLKFATDRLSFYGREELFSHPEFKNDINKLQKVFELLGDTSIFKNVEREMSGKDKSLMLKIGELQDNPDVSLVSAKIKIGEKDSGTIALVGPTRMDYEKALNALEYLIESIQDRFEKKEEEE